MPKPQASSLLQQDFCRRAVGRILACVAVLALVVMQAGMVWHGLEHVAKASGKISYSTNIVSVDKAQPFSGLCLKCLEDLSHSIGLISHTVEFDASLQAVVKQDAFVACNFATPVELANQRGPPVSLS